jgi:hypothetical protein
MKNVHFALNYVMLIISVTLLLKLEKVRIDMPAQKGIFQVRFKETESKKIDGFILISCHVININLIN